MDGPSLVDPDGLPFTTDRFHLDGRVATLKDFLGADQIGTPVPFD